MCYLFKHRLLVTATENYFEPDWSSRHVIATESLLLFTVCHISYEDFQRTFCVHVLFPILAACHTCLIIRDFSSFFFTMAQHPPVGHGLLITEASPSHSDAPQTVGLLWTSDQPDAATSTGQHTTLTRDKHPCPRRVSNPQSRQANGRRSTP